MDKGKGRAKVCPELPFELWDAIFAHYYDDWAASEYHPVLSPCGVSTGALLPLLISPDFYDRALEALYLHPMLSGTNILPFLVAIGSSSWSARAKRCFVRSLTVCTTAGMWRPLGRGDAAPPIEAPMHALLRLLPAPASLRIVDSGGMAAGPEDAFAALAQTSPRKARLEWALWDWAAPGDAALSGALGQGAHALVYAHAARTSHHTPSVLAASATPSTRLPHDALAWLRVLEDGGTYDVPRLWLETDPATANVQAAAAVAAQHAQLGSLAGQMQAAAIPAAPGAAPVHAFSSLFSNLPPNGPAPPLLLPAPTLLPAPLATYDIAAPLPPPATSATSTATSASSAASSSAAEVANSLPSFNSRSAMPSLRDARALIRQSIARRASSHGVCSQVDRAAVRRPSVTARVASLRSYASASSVRGSTADTAIDIDDDGDALTEVDDDDQNSESETVHAILRSPRTDTTRFRSGPSPHSTEYDCPMLFPADDVALISRLHIEPRKDTYSSPSDAHQIRQRVATLVQGWCPRLHALSLVTHDPLASLIVRAPDLDLWTHMPVPHIRVRLACATDPLTVMMGAKDVARDRERRARRAAGEIDPDDDDRVLGGDGNGYGLLHPNTRLFEIEVNTHAEMRAGADNWLRAGGQLPAAVCRIIAGEHDWGLVGTTRSRTFDDPVEVAPSSPATSAFPSPTFSFEVLSGDDEDVLMNENQGGSADGGGHMITA